MKEEFVDYFKILGIEPTHELSEIKKAYRNLAKKYHPDSNKEADPEMFKYITSIYEKIKTQDLLDEYFYKFVLNQMEKESQERVKKEQKTSKKPKRKKGKHQKSETMLKDLKSAYQKIKQDEKAYKEKQKRKNINHRINEMFKDDKTFSGKIKSNLLKGTIHLSAGFIHQLENIKKISKDSIPEYVLRNRKIIGLVTSVIIITNIASLPKDEVKSYKETDSVQSQETYIDLEKNITGYELIREYTIQEGDNLYELSKLSGTPIDQIKERNNLESNLIRTGDILEIPYEVINEDLEYYTTTEKINDESIYEIADKYETTVETLESLNKDAIVKINDKYVSLSEDIIVPKFISKTDLSNQKEAKTTEKTYFMK